MELVFKKDFFLNKLFACLFIVMFVIMCVIGTNTFASVDFTYNDNNYSFPDFPTNDYYYYLITYYSSSDSYFLICFNVDSDFYYDNVGDSIYFSNAPCDYDYCQYKLIDNQWGNMSATHYTSSNGIHVPLNNIFYSSFNLYDSNGNVVFQAPPQQVEGTQTTILTPIVQEQEMKPLEEIIQILPMILIVLVDLIAIRKAIQWIMRIMKRTIKIFLREFLLGLLV